MTTHIREQSLASSNHDLEGLGFESLAEPDPFFTDVDLAEDYPLLDPVVQCQDWHPDVIAQSRVKRIDWAFYRNFARAYARVVLPSLLRLFAYGFLVVFIFMYLLLVFPFLSITRMGVLYSCAKPALERYQGKFYRELSYFGIVTGWLDEPLEGAIAESQPVSRGVINRFSLARDFAAIIGAACVVKIAIRSLSTFLRSENQHVHIQSDGTTDVLPEVRALEKSTGCERPPSRSRENHINHWASFDVNHDVLKTPSKQPRRLAELATTVAKNVRWIGAQGSTVGSAYALGVCADCALFSRHTLRSPGPEGWTLSVYPSDKRDQSSCRIVRITEADFISVGSKDSDVILVRLRGNNFKDITKLFPTSVVFPSAGLPVLRAGGEESYSSRLFKSDVTEAGSDKGVVRLDNVGTCSMPNTTGDCGLPYLGDTGVAAGSLIWGIHVAGDVRRAQSFASGISYPALIEARDGLKGGFEVHSQGHISLPTGATGLGIPNDHHPIWFEPVKGIDFVGSVEGVYSSRPKVSKIKIEEDLIPYLKPLTGVGFYDDEGKPLFGKPKFRSTLVDGVYCAPYNNFLKGAGVIKNSLSPSISKTLVDYLSEYIVSNLRERGVERLAPIPLDHAVNGDPEDVYLRPMTMGTSSGYSWKGDKRMNSNAVELDFKRDSWMPDREVQSRVSEYIECYLKGETANPLLGAQLKDEPRSTEKIKYAKTRVFCMSPYCSTIVNRMFLAPFYTLMVEHGDIFSTAVGINMLGDDADALCRRLTEFSPFFMEGDYKGFDMSMPFDIGECASRIKLSILASFGYCSSALKVVNGIETDNLLPHVVVEDVILKIPGFQPSGKYATAEDNSLRGLCMLFYFWVATHCGKGGYTPADFHKYVLLVTYGDDLLAAVKPEIIHTFNNVTYQKFCKDVFRISYTDAAKSSVMRPYLNVKEISFLKRKFIYRDDLKRYVAPLEPSSIMKMLAFRSPFSDVAGMTFDDVRLSAASSALYELFSTLGETEFNARRAFFVLVYQRVFGIPVDVLEKVLPTHAQIFESRFGSG